MSDLAIKVENLGKLYRIGQREPFRTLRDTIIDAFTVPLSWLKKDSSLSAPCSKLQSNNGYIWALKDLSFEVKRGEVVGIIGGNGAGKSTLLKILSRITEPTEGYAEIHGRVGSLLEVGTGFHAELTGRENTYLNGAILGMKKAEIEKKFDEIVAFAEIDKFIDTPVKHYSSGMYVRLAFAVAAHLEPEILLVDEVLAVGDITFQKKCLGKMNDISRDGRTVLFVSHNMAAVVSLARMGILLDAGILHSKGDTQEVVREYLSQTELPKKLSWDVSNVPRRQENYGELIKITRIDICPNNSKEFLYGEGLRFQVHLMARSDQPYVCAGAGIDDQYGNRLVTFESHEVQFSFPTQRGKDYRLELHIPQPSLNPGLYSISMSLYSGKQYYDLLFQVAVFKISPIRSDTGEYFTPIPGAGPLRVPYRWKQFEDLHLSSHFLEGTSLLGSSKTNNILISNESLVKENL